jgi:hypothetical protein
MEWQMDVGERKISLDGKGYVRSIEDDDRRLTVESIASVDKAYDEYSDSEVEWNTDTATRKRTLDGRGYVRPTYDDIRRPIVGSLISLSEDIDEY